MDDIYGYAKNNTSNDTKNETLSRDLIDFMVTAGDNIYPRIDVAPTE